MSAVLEQIAGINPQLAQALEAFHTQLVKTAQVSQTGDGFATRTILSVYHNQTQSHTTSNAWETVTFNSEDDLRSVKTVNEPLGAHSKTTSTGKFLVPGDRSGRTRWLEVSARVIFAANATGSRGIRIIKNGAVFRRPAFAAAATAAGATRLTAIAKFPVDPGDELTIEAFQDSGGALTLGDSDRTNANECQWELI